MDKVKVSFNLSSQEVSTLKRLAEKRGSTVTDVLRRAIATEEFVQSAVENDQKILLESKDKKVPTRQLVIR